MRKIKSDSCFHTRHFGSDCISFIQSLQSTKVTSTPAAKKYSSSCRLHYYNREKALLNTQKRRKLKIQQDNNSSIHKPKQAMFTCLDRHEQPRVSGAFLAYMRFRGPSSPSYCRCGWLFDFPLSFLNMANICSRTLWFIQNITTDITPEQLWSHFSFAVHKSVC